MKITQIDVYRVALPFGARRADRDTPADRKTDPFNAASPALKRMESLMVRVRTDTGLEGWGEAFGHYINPVVFEALAGRVGKFFLDKAITQDPHGRPILSSQAEHAFYEFGATGPVTFALSALDTALWDILAKDRGLPLYRMLGAGRSTISCYASLPSYGNDPTEVARQTAWAHRQGFKAIKLHETDAAAIFRAREVLPEGTALMVDVNCAWSAPDARSAIAALKAAELCWVEEPVWPANDIAGLHACREQGTPIAAGENAAGLQDILRHLASRAVDVIQPSLAKIGGVSAMLDIIQAARIAGITVAPHCFYLGPGLCASAQIIATLPDPAALETPLLEWPELLHPMLKPAPTLALPDAPGIGFDPDWGVLRQHLIASRTLA